MAKETKTKTKTTNIVANNLPKDVQATSSELKAKLATAKKSNVADEQEQALTADAQPEQGAVGSQNFQLAQVETVAQAETAVTVETATTSAAGMSMTTVGAIGAGAVAVSSAGGSSSSAAPGVPSYTYAQAVTAKAAGSLPAQYSLSDASLTAANVANAKVSTLATAQAAAVAAVRADAIVHGATNGATMAVANGAYTLDDSLANLTAATAVRLGATSYTLSDTSLTAANVVNSTVAGLVNAQAAAITTKHADLVVAGATNGASISVVNGTYTLADTLAHLSDTAGGVARLGTQSYTLTDASLTAANVSGVTVAGLAAAQSAALAAIRSNTVVHDATNGATIAVANGTYTLSDTLANLTAATAVRLGATSYTLSDTSLTAANVVNSTVAGLAAAQTAAIADKHAETVVAGATNGATIAVANGAYTLSDTLANLTVATAVRLGATSYTLADTSLTAASVVNSTVAGLAAAQTAAIADKHAETVVAGATNGATIHIDNGHYSLVDNAVALADNSVMVAGSTAVTVNGASASASDLTGVNEATSHVVDATGLTTITGTAAAVVTLVSEIGITLPGTYSVIVTGSSASALHLTTIQEAASGHVDATGVVTVTGTTAEIIAAINDADIVLSNSYGATVTGVASATDIIHIDQSTTGQIDATAVTRLTGAASDVLSVYYSTAVNTSPAFGILLADEANGSTAASDLLTIDSFTSTTVDASVVAAISGVVADVESVIAASTIATSLRYNVTLTDVGGVAVADILTVHAATSGVITATVLEHDAATLTTLTGTNDLTISVTGAATASDLITIDGVTTHLVNANGVTALTGTAADIATAVSSTGMDATLATGMIVDAGSVAATDLNTIATKVTAGVDARSATAITGGVVDVESVIANADITTSGSYAVTLTDVGGVAVADILTVHAATSGVITATVLEHDAATLTTLTGTNDLTISVTGAATASDLTTIDGVTTETADLSGVDNISGTGQEFVTLLSELNSNTVLNLGSAAHLNVTMTDVADYQTILDVEALRVNHQGVTDLTGVTEIDGSSSIDQIDVSSRALATGVVINGHGGSDDINITGNIANVVVQTFSNGSDSITGFDTADKLQFHACTSYLSLASIGDLNVVLHGVSLLDAVNFASTALAAHNANSTLNGAVGFTYDNNQYVMIDGANNGFSIADDAIVKIGTTALSHLTATNFIA